MGRARDISKVFSTGTALATDTEVSAFNYLTQSSASTVYQTKATAGLTLLTPGSITNTGGTASIGANGTVTFSGVSSQSINNVFSTTYDSYFLTWTIDGSTTAQSLTMRVRVSGSDNSSADYNSAAWGGNSEVASPIIFGNTVGGTSFPIGAVKSGSEVNSGQMFIHNPFISTIRTTINAGYSFADTYYRNYQMASMMSVTTSYTGVTFITASGNISGTVRIYGINK